MRKATFYIILFFAWLWMSCNAGKEKLYPTYIHVDSFSFVANPSVKGITLSHQVSCVWAYYNNSPIGVFDLPATFPVLANGKGTLELFPGITINGQNDLTGVYPFYEPDTFNFIAQPGKTINRLPVTRYYSNIKSNIISNFDSGHTNFFPNGGSVTMNLAPNGSVFEGAGSGMISLARPGVDSAFDSSVHSFSIPKGVAFIEFNYKSSIPFSVFLQANYGTIASLAPYPLAGIYPSDHWQKFYVSVANFAAQAQGRAIIFILRLRCRAMLLGRYY